MNANKVRRKNEGLPRVGVVILNYNGKEMAESCLRSVVESTYAGKDVILVDNASTDGSAAYLRTRFPDALVLEMSKNRGVAGGRNYGFREAVRRGNDYILSLDNDTRVDALLIEELVAVAESDPRVGVLGPKTYADDGSGRLQCAGGRITYMENVTAEQGSGEIDRGQYDEIVDVDYIPGSGFMARREVFERLNFVDENFHGGGHEDTDFCKRAVQLGYRVVYVPSAVMWHRGSATFGGYTAQRKYWEAINSVYFVRRHGKPKDCMKYAFFAGFGLIYAFIVQSLRGNQKAVFAKARGIWHGLRKPVA